MGSPHLLCLAYLSRTLTMASNDAILLEIRAPYAIITLNQPQKKNALDSTLYKRLSALLQEIDAKPEVFVTVLTGRGDFFSAGADVKSTREALGGANARVTSLERLSGSNLDLTRSFYRHSKILVAGLNGPAIGLSAALLGHFDFVYAVPTAYFLTPFSAISLVCEGGASEALVQRMGLGKANECARLSLSLSLSLSLLLSLFTQLTQERPGLSCSARSSPCRSSSPAGSSTA